MDTIADISYAGFKENLEEETIHMFYCIIHHLKQYSFIDHNETFMNIENYLRNYFVINDLDLQNLFIYYSVRDLIQNIDDDDTYILTLNHYITLICFDIFRSIDIDISTQKAIISKIIETVNEQHNYSSYILK